VGKGPKENGTGSTARDRPEGHQTVPEDTPPNKWSSNPILDYENQRAR